MYRGRRLPDVGAVSHTIESTQCKRRQNVRSWPGSNRRPSASAIPESACASQPVRTASRDWAAKIKDQTLTKHVNPSKIHVPCQKLHCASSAPELTWSTASIRYASRRNSFLSLAVCNEAIRIPGKIRYSRVGAFFFLLELRNQFHQENRTRYYRTISLSSCSSSFTRVSVLIATLTGGSNG